MKKVQLISVLVFAFAAFVSVDFGLNFAASLVPALNDGIGSRSVLQGLFGVFGDTGWTSAKFFLAFEKSLWITFFLFLANIVVWALRKKK